MSVVEYCFPRFQPGQVLTDRDLNDLRADVVARLLELGTLVGFGVGCGLDGSVVNGKLRIASGYAVDQKGRLILARQAFADMAIAATAPAVTFPFVDANAGGLSAVLRVVPHEDAAPGDCGDAECEGHSVTVCERPEVVLVAGRLSAGSDLLADSVFGLQALRVSGSTVQGAFVALRDGLVAALRRRGVNEASLAKLQGIQKSGPPAHDVLRASLLNTVLYAAWDLYRCAAWMQVTCFRDANPPGVVLGHLVQQGGTWVWECQWRHHFELSAAIYRAILGHRCDDPCARIRERIEFLIDSFALPEIPPAGDPPRDDGPDIDVHICPWIKGIGGLNYFGCKDHPVYFPPDDLWEVNPDWFPDKGDPWPFDPGYIDPVPDPWLLDIDPHRTGILDVSDLLGRPPGDVQGPLINILKEGGVTTPLVEVVTPEDLADIGDYRATPTVAANDRIVVVAEGGRVIETGVVRAQTILRDVTSTLPAAFDAAKRAEERAGDALGRVDQFDGTLTQLQSDLGDLGDNLRDFRTGLQDLDFEGQLGDFRDALDGLTREFQSSAGTTIGLVKDAVLGEVQGLVQVQLNQVREQMRTLVDEKIQTLRTDLGGVQKDVGTRVDRLVEGFVGAKATGAQQPATANAAMAEAFKGLRQAVLSAATLKQREKVEEALAPVEGDFQVIEAAAGKEMPLLATEGEAVARVAEALSLAARAAGAKGSDMARVYETLAVLKERTG